MILASYNVENMFLRARALNRDDSSEGKGVLEKHVQLNKLLGKAHYSAADKEKIVKLLGELGLRDADDGGRFAILRQNRGRLLTRHQDGSVDVVAEGRGSWIGWVDLKVEAVDEEATRQTAHVIRDVNADVLALVETESRPAMVRFAETILSPQGGGSYPHAMLIDGNDDRGIDVGIMMKSGYEITSMVSHVDDVDAEGRIFSRDCPVFNIATPKGNELTVLVNHLKSKGFGSQADNDRKRLRQAQQVVRIYQALRGAGKKHVAILGDFNDTLDSDPLRPLAQAGLNDVSQLQAFDSGPDPERTGTFKNCTAREKIDHIFLSPELVTHFQRGAIERRGVWGGTHGTLFPHYPEITKESQAASDHAAIWAELDF
jgi:endonuclease/exonuclease/phosphatase family metal-dependent hydrolase